jgi:hypothetical protein
MPPARFQLQLERSIVIRTVSMLLVTVDYYTSDIVSSRVWFRAIMSYDGNQRSVRKAKKVDAGDICLSDGLAYFPLKEPYKEWTENNYNPQRTVHYNINHRPCNIFLRSLQTKPVCDNHKAGNDTGVRWVGQDVTGLGAIVCSSHGCAVPRGMVDYFKGER